MIRFFIVKQRTSRLVPGSVTAVLDFVEDPVSRYTDTEYSFSRIYINMACYYHKQNYRYNYFLIPFSNLFRVCDNYEFFYVNSLER